MNRTREQLMAAKAKKEWQRLQEEKLKEEEKDTHKKPNLKKVKNGPKEDSLKDIA